MEDDILSNEKFLKKLSDQVSPIYKKQICSCSLSRELNQVIDSDFPKEIQHFFTSAFDVMFYYPYCVNNRSSIIGSTSYNSNQCYDINEQRYIYDHIILPINFEDASVFNDTILNFFSLPTIGIKKSDKRALIIVANKNNTINNNNNREQDILIGTLFGVCEEQVKEFYFDDSFDVSNITFEDERDYTDNVIRLIKVMKYLADTYADDGACFRVQVKKVWYENYSKEFYR